MTLPDDGPDDEESLPQLHNTVVVAAFERKKVDKTPATRPARRGHTPVRYLEFCSRLSRSTTSPYYD